MTSPELRKIAITGPESTGKSFLSSRLADHYGSVFVPEMARSYLDTLGHSYAREDISAIARLQLLKEKEMQVKAGRVFITDTEFIVLKIWSLHKYGVCDPWILRQIEENKYDLYLLCDIDLPWEYDPQREHPHMRTYFFDWYRDELEAYGFPYKVISGIGDMRISNAVQAIDQHFNLSH